MLQVSCPRGNAEGQHHHPAALGSSGHCCFVTPPGIFSWNSGAALPAQIPCHAPREMVKNVMASAWRSLQGFKQFEAEKTHQLARKDGLHPKIFNALNSCSQQTQTKRVQQFHSTRSLAQVLRLDLGIWGLF